jgi:hypothetical protein
VPVLSTWNCRREPPVFDTRTLASALLPEGVLTLMACGVSTMFGGVTATATGRRSVGWSSVPTACGVSTTLPKFHAPLAGNEAELTVIFTDLLSPGLSVNSAGDTVPVRPCSFTVQAWRTACVLRNTRVNTHRSAQLALPRLGRLSAVTSPPAAGLAAMKLARVSLSTRPARTAWSTCTRPAPRSNGVPAVTLSSR